VSGADDDAARAFNKAINARDLDALGRLMHDEHRFVDSAGTTVDGKPACLDAWRGFFAAFPDYRNIFDQVVSDGGGGVAIRGRSECSEPALTGPAHWHAIVEHGLLREWRVSAC
jgi:ketosteroid isomerase-like protein